MNKIDQIRIPLTVKECSLNSQYLNLEICKNPEKIAKYNNLYNQRNLKQRLLHIPRNAMSGIRKQDFNDSSNFIGSMTDQIYFDIVQGDKSNNSMSEYKKDSPTINKKIEKQKEDLKMTQLL